MSIRIITSNVQLEADIEAIEEALDEHEAAAVPHPTYDLMQAMAAIYAYNNFI
jgi:hypothetical protein